MDSHLRFLRFNRRAVGDVVENAPLDNPLSAILPPNPRPTSQTLPVGVSTGSRASSTTDALSRSSSAPVSTGVATSSTTSITTSATPTGVSSTTSAVVKDTASTQEQVVPLPSSTIDTRPSVVIKEQTTTVSRESGTPPAASTQLGATTGNDFLDNKVLSGIVFGICGLVFLLLLGLIIWFARRKSRRNRKLEREIISWDPERINGFHSDRSSSVDGSSPVNEKAMDEGSADGHYNYTLPNKEPAPFSDYRPPQRPIKVAFPPRGVSTQNRQRTVEPQATTVVPQRQQGYTLPSQLMRQNVQNA